MAYTSVEVAASPETVWSVLAEPGAYGEWVVGAQKVTRADADWPNVGTALEYEVGVGPASVGDRTVVVEADPPRLLVLRVELQRLGAATIRLELEADNGATRVRMEERPTDGLVDAVHTPLSDAALKLRNDAALDRLKRMAEARA